MQKVIYFTAGAQMTPDEVTELNDLIANQYNVVVRNGAGDMAFGPRNEDTDYVAGTVPTAYESFPVWTGGGSGPQPGDPINVTNSTGAVTVAGVVGDAGQAVLPAANAIVAGAGAITLKDASGTTAPGTFDAITAGVVAGATITAGTTTLAKHNDGVNLQTSTGTAVGAQVQLQVASGVALGARLSDTTAAVKNADALTVPVTGTYATTATFTVAGGVITGIVLS